MNVRGSLRRLLPLLVLPAFLAGPAGPAVLDGCTEDHGAATGTASHHAHADHDAFADTDAGTHDATAHDAPTSDAHSALHHGCPECACPAVPGGCGLVAPLPHAATSADPAASAGRFATVNDLEPDTLHPIEFFRPPRA